MTPEHLLDAMGLLDDDLIQDAEQYIRRKPRVNYSRWLGWAAAFAIVVTLGYGATHVRMGGNSAASGGSTGGAADLSVPSGELIPPESNESDLNQSGGLPPVGEPGNPLGEASEQEDWLFALRVDGTVYWATEEYIRLEPEEETIRYTTSFINSAEPEEDGQANFLPVGRAYVVLDNGTVAVLQEDTGSWRVYDSVPPWEK